MLLDLTEILSCPACGPPNRLITMVEVAEGRRVARGTLGCPLCAQSYAIEQGRVRLGPFILESAAEARPDVVDSGAGDDAADAGDDAADSATARETAILLAALCDLACATGYVVLGPGLRRAARELRNLAPALEIVSLAHGGVGPASTNLVSLPFLDDRFAAVALLANGPFDLVEAARVVRVGGRVVVLGALPPGEEPPAPPLRLLAADRRASVFVREGPTAGTSATLPDGPGPV